MSYLKFILSYPNFILSYVKFNLTQTKIQIVRTGNSICHIEVFYLFGEIETQHPYLIYSMVVLSSHDHYGWGDETIPTRIYPTQTFSTQTFSHRTLPNGTFPIRTYSTRIISTFSSIPPGHFFQYFQPWTFPHPNFPISWYTSQPDISHSGYFPSKNLYPWTFFMSDTSHPDFLYLDITHPNFL